MRSTQQQVAELAGRLLLRLQGQLLRRGLPGQQLALRRLWRQAGPQLLGKLLLKLQRPAAAPAAQPWPATQAPVRAPAVDPCAQQRQRTSTPAGTKHEPQSPGDASSEMTWQASTQSRHGAIPLTQESDCKPFVSAVRHTQAARAGGSMLNPACLSNPAACGVEGPQDGARRPPALCWARVAGHQLQTQAGLQQGPRQAAAAAGPPWPASQAHACLEWRHAAHAAGGWCPSGVAGRQHRAREHCCCL